MYYVCSDLHGYDISSFLRHLHSVGFNDNDWLYILGDVIDRGPDGVKYLTWLLEQGNVELILGNHESMLTGCSFIFNTVDEFAAKPSPEKMKKLSTWMANGAQPTVTALKELQQRAPEQIDFILEYLNNECPVYDTVETPRGDFLLVHGGLGNFSPDKKLTDYTKKEMLWYKTRPSDVYFEDVKTIFGHVPTLCYDEKFRGKCIKTKTWINVDAGCAAGEKPMLLRLDDMKEFYF